MHSSVPVDYLEGVTRYIVNHSDRPFALFGHSLGAIFALRICENLSSSDGPEPVLLIVSGPPPPGEINLTESAKLAMFRHFLGARAKGDASLRDNFMADFFVCEGLPRGHLPLRRTSIAAYFGSDDSFVNKGSLELWREITEAEFSIRAVPGDHFYLQQDDSRGHLLSDLAKLVQEKSILTIVV
jgi:surfactin synthase thioesterase subunit